MSDSTTTDTTVDRTYDASSLQKLEIRDQIRRRPGMWIGNTGLKGLHHTIWEIVDNCVDEFMAGAGKLIVVEVGEDGWVTVTDEARGIPVDLHKESGMYGVDLVLTQVGGGGKFGGADSGYKVSGGLHGVGSSVVNFLSKQMKVTIWRDGHEWHREYKTGTPQGKLRKGKKTKKTGTAISWIYDDTIFDKDVAYDREIIVRRLRELSYLNPGLTLELRFPGHKPERFLAEGGLADYMKALVSDRDGVEAVHKKPLLLSGSVTDIVDGSEDTTFIDLALYWTTAQHEAWHAFTNAISNPDGGTHYDGMRRGLRKAIHETIEEFGKYRAKDDPIEQSDTREGLFNAIMVKVSDPQFESQTKVKLNNPEVEKRVSDFVAREVKAWMLAKENKSQAENIIARVLEARDGRLAARKARNSVTERKGLIGSSLPGKLADCTNSDPEGTEIFICEGDSAGAGLKQTRDRATQAVLPLRGKIRNAEKAGEGVLDSEAIRDILAAIGGVITDVKVPVVKRGKTVNVSKLIVDVSEPRYERVAIAADADVDGGHIVTLLLTFFYRYAPSLIAEGRLFIAELPLFRVEHKRKGRLYLYSDEELETMIKKDEIKTRPDGTPNVLRFKGLGEMMPNQLQETVLDNSTRRLRQVVIDDPAEAEDMTTLLMGSRVPRRREYIEEHALEVEADV